MPLQHELLVVGGGPGGYTAAIRAAQLGLNVGLIDQEATLGGTCLRVGCIPSKALLESSELLYESRKNFGLHGIRFTDLRLDLAAMMLRKQQIVSTLGKGIDYLLKKNRITRYHGQASLKKGGGLQLKSASEEQELKAPRLIIAAGSKPITLPGVELDGDRVVTSTEALSFNEVPPLLIVIGAGYIGLELGSVWQRLGSKVVVVEYLERILPGMDDEIAQDALKSFQKTGLEFLLGRKVDKVSVSGNKCHLTLNGSENLQADRVLVAVGRSPNTEPLGAASAGLELDEKGRIRINEHFETNLPGIYAIGDVVRGPMLAHKAEEEGIACVEQMVTGQSHLNYDTIPGVVYTQPEIATVGKTEEQLQAEQVAYRKGQAFFRANGRALALGQAEGKVKILADQRTDRILGVHIIGPKAGELIAEAAMAMSCKASSEDLARTIHAHPTLSETLKEAALAVDQRAIHS